MSNLKVFENNSNNNESCKILENLVTLLLVESKMPYR